MPVKTLAIIAVLLVINIAFVLGAWATGSEIYVFYPAFSVSHDYHVSLPPTHPMELLIMLPISWLLAVWSPRYGLIAFTILTLGVPLGSVVGFVVFGWTPSACQHLLTLSVFASLGYCWSHHEMFDY